MTGFVVSMSVFVSAFLTILLSVGKRKFYEQQKQGCQTDLAKFCNTEVDKIWWARQNQLLARCSLYYTPTETPAGHSVRG